MVMGYIIATVPLIIVACISIFYTERQKDELIKYIQENTNQTIEEIKNELIKFEI